MVFPKLMFLDRYMTYIVVIQKFETIFKTLYKLCVALGLLFMVYERRLVQNLIHINVFLHKNLYMNILVWSCLP